MEMSKTEREKSKIYYLDLIGLDRNEQN